jgi:hypothetical protein
LNTRTSELLRETSASIIVAKAPTNVFLVVATLPAAARAQHCEFVLNLFRATAT